MLSVDIVSDIEITGGFHSEDRLVVRGNGSR